MNFEASTGYTVIEEEIRTSVLYVYIMQRKPVAWQERMLKIIDKGTSLPKNWKMRMPNFDSHVDSDGSIPIEEEPSLDPYEEE